MRRVKFRATTWPAIGFPNFFHAGGHFKDILNCRKAARAALVVTQFEATARAVRRAAFPNRWYSLWPDRGPRCVELFAVPALLPASYRTGGGLQRLSHFCSGASRSAVNGVLGRLHDVDPVDATIPPNASLFEAALSSPLLRAPSGHHEAEHPEMLTRSTPQGVSSGARDGRRRSPVRHDRISEVCCVGDKPASPLHRQTPVIADSLAS